MRQWNNGKVNSEVPLPWEIINNEEGVAYFMDNAPLKDKKKDNAPLKGGKKKHLPVKEDILIPYKGRYVKRLQGVKGFSSEPPPYRHSQDSRPTDTTSTKYPSRRYL